MTGKKIKIAPSMMCADFLNMGSQIELFEKTDIDYLHVDIMDGHYVPNFTLGPDFCRVLDGCTSIPLDIHLMIEDVDRYIPAFAGFEGAVVSFHPEASYHPIRSVQLIKDFGARAGIALDPALGLESIRYLLPEVSLVCVMTVNPGYAGQVLIPQTLPKIKELAGYISRQGLQVEIEVDGNVSWQNVPDMLEAEADVLVAGSSSIFKSGEDLEENILRLKDLVNKKPD
jgi:ribulose-phosphate 3-epimerase